MKRYVWENTFNTRDLGHTPTAAGDYIKCLSFIRSDAPCKITDEAKDFLLRNNIRTVIDLRGEKTSKAKPNAFTGDARFMAHNFPLSVNPKVPKSEEIFIENYYGMLENDDAICNIFHTMADAEGGVLFHCQAGKDRTGMIAALLLLLGGVADIDIIADYAISNAYLHEMAKAVKAIPKRIPDYLIYVRPEYMEAVLAYLRGKYGNIENYLLKKGILQVEIGKLKGKLMDKHIRTDVR